MARLTQNTLVTHPDTHDLVPLAAGDEIPEWAADLIGAHLVDVPASAPTDDEKSDDEPEGEESTDTKDVTERAPAKRTRASRAKPAASD